MNVKCVAQRLTYRKHKKPTALLNYYYERALLDLDIEMVMI